MTPIVMTTVQPMNMLEYSVKANTNLLDLLHISSPALPVGAFAYSQGLEYTLDAQWCENAQEIEQWIELVLLQGLGQLDLPMYLRMYKAWQDKDYASLRSLNDELLAFRESKELYLEDIQVGSAYVQWHLGQDVNRKTLLDELDKPSVVAMASLAAVLSNIPVEMAMQGFLWSWCENQITCACKALPMGQTQAQQVLQRLIPKMKQCVSQSFSVKGDDMGTGLFGLAMASSLHELQYSRLVRS